MTAEFFPMTGRWRLTLRLWLALASRRSDSTPEVAPNVVDEARRGDPRAFVELIRAYEPRLRALAYRLLNDRNLTDDVLQEAYVRAFKSLGRFRGDASLGTWLYRITYNACIDELRRGRKVGPLFPEVGPEPVDARSGPEETAIGRRDLAAALASLPPDLRAAVILVDADGLDYAAAGHVLGVPAGTVGSRLNKARAVLRTALGVSG
jgi:RNA polymerase sigma-70 factor (ECF subfamily)